jgi:hypothetical protein
MAASLSALIAFRYIRSMRLRSPDTAPRDGTLIRIWFRSSVDPVICYWSRRGFGWAAYHERCPLLRHDVSGWQAVDQIVARAIPLTRVKRHYRGPLVVLGLGAAAEAARLGHSV